MNNYAKTMGVTHAEEPNLVHADAGRATLCGLSNGIGSRVAFVSHAVTCSACQAIQEDIEFMDSAQAGGNND